MQMLHDPECISFALARSAFQTGTVRIVNPNLAGFSHIVASRQGLFAINENVHSLIAHGMFFGITLLGTSIFVFESCDLPRARTKRGRIVRLTRERDRIEKSEVILSGLDNGCHQIDFVDGKLCILDTYNQRLLIALPDGSDLEYLYPFSACKGRDWSRGYGHANSLLHVGNTNLILMHNGGEQTGQQSSIVVFDCAWRLLECWKLSGLGCHNIAVLQNGMLLVCNSIHGELISRDGFRLKISSMMTRGLSAGIDSIAVGASSFSSRQHRHLQPGTVTFLNRGFEVRAVLDIPGSPTEIRRLDGCDFSLSNYATSELCTNARRQVCGRTEDDYCSPLCK
jgi:hypothetical protein